MADRAATARNPVEVSISPSQLNAILKSHRELHEVVIKITEILQDPSRSASYQSFPRQDKRDVNLPDENPQPDVSKASHSNRRPFGTSNDRRRGSTEGYQEVNEPKSRQSILGSSNTYSVPDYSLAGFQVRDGEFYRRNTWHKLRTISFALVSIASVKHPAGFLLLEDIPKVYVIQ